MEKRLWIYGHMSYWHLTDFKVGIPDEVYAGSYDGSRVDGIKVKACLKLSTLYL